ncbi:MAG TPA: TonB-dependent receptor, partial [Bryobacteraceae bacterium]|nr:TonB-dependent receptor [Bryobacteraceae bacterium]
LPAGMYDVNVEAQGFKKFTQQGVTVAVAQTARVDIIMQIGSTAETVNVTADAPLLRTESAEQSHNITGERINNLPVNFGVTAGGYVRSPFAFINIMPGANTSGQNNIRINGFTNNIQMRFEGQESSNSNSAQRVDELQPSVEAVQEFTLQTSNFSAEYGQVGGGLFNFTAKSGTNAFHGSAYEYFANEALNAGMPFTNNGQGELIRPRSRKHDFGFSVGGPVRIPKLYDGRNRTFFFGNVEFYRDKKVNSGSYQTLPTDAFRSGDFSAALTGRVLGTDPLGRPILENQIYDPATTRTVNGFVVRDPFPGNIIPRDRMDPLALKIQDMIPRATRAGQVNNWEQVYPFDKIQDVPSIKLDHSFSSNSKMSFYAGRFRTDQYVNPDGLPEPLTQLRILKIRSETYRANYDHTLTPTLLLHLGAGFLKYRNPETGVPGSVDYDSIGQLGLVGPAVTPSGFPRLTGLGSNFGGVGVPLGPSHAGLYVNDKPTALASVTYVRGSHTLKTGAEWRIDIFSNSRRLPGFGNFGFDAQQTGLPSTQQQPLPGGTSVGLGYASFLLGQVNSASVGSPDAPHYRKTSWSLFLQDTWKVTRRLTFDYGVRWDMQGAAREIHDRVAMFDPTVANPAAGGLLGGTAYEGYGPGRCNCTFAETYPYAIGPRLGVAYQINDKTVIRAGWGITYNTTAQFNYLDGGRSLGTGWNTINFQSPAFGAAATTLTQGLVYNPGDLYRASFDPGIRPQPGQLNNPPALVDANGGRPGRINQWNISLQREISSNLVVEAAYIGNRGNWLTQNNLVDFNAVTPDRLRSVGLDINNAADRTLLRQRVDSPAVQARGFRAPYAAFPGASTLAQSLRPYPQFGNLGPMWAPLGSSWYDALQAKLTKRYSHGLDMSVAFTWQKELTTDPGGSIINDVFNRENQKFISNQSRPLALVVAFNYELPRFTENRIVGAALGGWTVGGIMRYQSGLPIPVPTSNNNLGQLLFRGTRMNRVAGEPLFLVDDINCDGCFDPNKDFILNPRAWADPSDGQWGSSAGYYNDYRYRRVPDEQLSLGRIFRIKERMNFRIRAEFFNVFNRTVLPDPTGNNPAATPARNNLGMPTAGFGYINTTTFQSQTGGAIPTSRNGQLVARFEW